MQKTLTYKKYDREKNTTEEVTVNLTCWPEGPHGGTDDQGRNWTQMMAGHWNCFTAEIYFATEC